MPFPSTRILPSALSASARLTGPTAAAALAAGLAALLAAGVAVATGAADAGAVVAPPPLQAARRRLRPRIEPAMVIVRKVGGLPVLVTVDRDKLTAGTSRFPVQYSQGWYVP